MVGRRAIGKRAGARAGRRPAAGDRADPRRGPGAEGRQLRLAAARPLRADLPHVGVPAL